MNHSIKINGSRLLNTLHDLQKFTDTPEDGVTRFSYGVQDAKAREYILSRARATGCTISVDPLGNIRIGLPSNVPGRKSVMAGSHIDTVRNGGWLDGIYGVCGALEVMETLAERAEQTKQATQTEQAAGNPSPSLSEEIEYNYEMVIFAEEEGSNFGSTMTGSKFITGQYDESTLDKLVNDEGKTLKQVLLDWYKTDAGKAATGENSAGVTDVDVSNIKWDFDSIKTMLELHIEQGPVLDRENLSIGIVDAIFGMKVIEVTLTGVGNHAGATPMAERYDALCTAAECVLKAEEIVKNDIDKRTVVTVGKMELSPNCSNVIPETVKFSLEVRDKDNAKIVDFIDKIKATIREIAENRRVLCEIRDHSSSEPLPLTGRLVNSMELRAKAQKIPHKVMDSGAVHDACMIAAFADTGMIFVPSINGRSHVPEENTRDADLVTGVQFLMDTVIDELIGK